MTTYELGASEDTSLSLVRGFRLVRLTAGTLWHFCEGRVSATGYQHLQDFVRLLTAQIDGTAAQNPLDHTREHSLGLALYRLDTRELTPTTDQLLQYLRNLRAELMALIAADRTTLNPLQLYRLERIFREAMEELEPTVTACLAA